MWQNPTELDGLNSSNSGKSCAEKQCQMGGRALSRGEMYIALLPCGLVVRKMKTPPVRRPSDIIWVNDNARIIKRLDMHQVPTSNARPKQLNHRVVPDLLGILVAGRQPMIYQVHKQVLGVGRGGDDIEPMKTGCTRCVKVGER